jgi:hypothetical protein
MRQILLLVAALLGLFALVPLSAWAATGRWREAVRAARGYAIVLAVLGSVSVLAFIASLIGSAA